MTEKDSGPPRRRPVARLVRRSSPTKNSFLVWSLVSDLTTRMRNAKCVKSWPWLVPEERLLQGSKIWTTLSLDRAVPFSRNFKPRLSSLSSKRLVVKRKVKRFRDQNPVPSNCNGYRNNVLIIVFIFVFFCSTLQICRRCVRG